MIKVKIDQKIRRSMFVVSYNVKKLWLYNNCSMIIYMLYIFADIIFLFCRSCKSNGQTDDDEAPRKRKKRFVTLISHLEFVKRFIELRPSKMCVLFLDVLSRKSNCTLFRIPHTAICRGILPRMLQACRINNCVQSCINLCITQDITRYRMHHTYGRNIVMP